MDGILRCSRYAFGPNRLHYCGPDQNTQLYANIKEKAVDPDLLRILSQFETMHPYLVHIAHANNIKEPLDERVVEAYWVGNTLLDNVNKQLFYEHLVDGLSLKKKLGQSFSLVEEKIGLGAVPHHSFHVLDIWRRTGHVDREHTLESMDDCLVSSGVVESVEGPFISVARVPLLYENRKLLLGAPVVRRYARKLESDYEIEQLKKGDIVSIHWGVICERISLKQAASLRKYTLLHIALANLTI